MNLPIDLISQFAKITNDKKETKNESIVYGTIAYVNGKTHVVIDGSEISTPVVTTADVINGERVTVMIKNHTATVIGNLSSPSARTDDLKNLENRANTGEFNGEDATTLRIESSRGTVFKNSEVSTVLSVVIYKGSQRITDIEALRAAYGSGAYIEWSWQRMGENIFGTILSTDSRIGNDGFTFTLSSADVDTKVTFMCQLITD